MLSGTCGDFYAGAVVGRTLTLQNTGNLTELAAYFLYHLLGGTTDGLHGESAEQEGCHGTDEGTDEHLGVHQVHLEVVHEVGDGSIGSGNHLAFDVLHHHSGTLHGNLNFLDVRCQQCQCREGCRTDGKAFTGSGGGVTQGVKGIGTMAHLFSQLTHLGVTTGIVGNRTVGVGSQGDAQCGEHAHGGNADAVQTVCQTLARHAQVETVGKAEAEDDGHTDGDDGDAGGYHARAYTFYYNSSGTRQSCLRNLLGGLVRVRRVVLGGLSDDDTGCQSADDREGESQPVLDA